MSSHTETPPAPTSARWSTAAALVVGWALVVLLLLYFLEVRPRLRSDAPSVATVRTAQPDFPAPPVGAVVYSRQMGDTALALGVVPEPGRVIAQASVVGPEGEGVSGLDVSFDTHGSTVTGRTCGAGCYRAALPTVTVPKALDVVVDGDSTTRWSVPLPESWPPADADRLVTRAERVWRALRSLSFDETLRSDESHVVTSSWQAAGARPTRVPDRRRRLRGHRRQAALGPGAGQAVEGVTTAADSPADTAMGGCHECPRRRYDRGTRPAGARRHLLRPEDAGLVHGDRRPQDLPHVRRAHGRDRALHARPVPLVRRDAGHPTTRRLSAGSLGSAPEQARPAAHQLGPSHATGGVTLFRPPP